MNDSDEVESLELAHQVYMIAKESVADLDVLKLGIDDEEISMVFKTGTSPCVVRPVEGDAYEYLILPVRIPTM